MSDIMNAHPFPITMLKYVCKSVGKQLRYSAINSKILSMLNFLSQHITCSSEANGVVVANVVKASVQLVQIAPAWVRILAEAATKMDIGMAPTLQCPNDPAGTEWKTSKMTAELGLWKNKQLTPLSH